MNILFSIGLGIFPEQRVARWQMVARLFHALGTSLQQLGHQIFYVCHPEAMVPELPPHLVWLAEEHEHLDFMLARFEPDYVFTWNGSSPGDRITATIASSLGARMVFAEQGWLPQKDTLYFDLAGCNGSCSTRNKRWPAPIDTRKLKHFDESRQKFLAQTGVEFGFYTESMNIRPFDLTKPVFVPLQDERDTNILLDSPFKTMQAFLQYLHDHLPDIRFDVRPHPKYPTPQLEALDRVRILDPKKSMFAQLATCGGVIGINSTTLIEGAMLGYSVASLGRSLATGTGLFLDLPADESLDCDMLLNHRPRQNDALGMLYHLLCEKQFPRSDLADPVQVFRAGFFQDLVRLKNWNPISR